MSTSGTVIHYIGWGCQSSESPGNTLLNGNLVFNLHSIFQKCIPGIKQDLPVYRCKKFGCYTTDMKWECWRKKKKQTVSYSCMIWISFKTPVLLAAAAQEYQSSYLYKNIIPVICHTFCIWLKELSEMSCNRNFLGIF